MDIHFDDASSLPSIHEALKIERQDGRELIIEVQQHIGEDTVRCVAMDSTDGLRRGMSACSTGAPIEMPVGSIIRGRVMNVTGESIDGVQFLKEGDICEAMVHAATVTILTCEMPTSVVLEITYTEPGIKGDTATGGSKNATMDTGYVVKVPLFINEGDVLAIDTRTGDYISRA